MEILKKEGGRGKDFLSSRMVHNTLVVTTTFGNSQIKNLIFLIPLVKMFHFHQMLAG